MVNQQSLNELALFAGAGGGILGGKLLGWRTVCAVEWEPYPASVLCARQNDGLLPTFPVWDAVQTFDGKPWRGIVDVVSGGFPCQDISSAGKGAGIDGERSGMWKHMARVVGEVRPRYVFVENSPMLVTRGLERVLGDLTALGYDTKWTVMGAADVGANHQRDRIWIVGKSTYTDRITDALRGDSQAYEKGLVERRIYSGGGISDSRKGCEEITGQSSEMADTPQLFSNGSNNNARIGLERETQSESRNNCGTEKLAYTDSQRQQTKGDSQFNSPASSDWQTNQSGSCCQISTNADLSQCQRSGLSSGIQQENSYACDSRWWAIEPDVGRVADGVAARVDRLKAIGNGQVPLCAASAWRLLTA